MKGRFQYLKIFLLILFFFNSLFVFSLEFSYKYNTGDKYRIVSTVNQDIFVDRRLSFRAEIINRIAFEVTAFYNGKARISAVYQTAEKTQAMGANARNTGNTGNQAPRTFQWDKEYSYELEQDRLGYMTVGDQYYMPMVRNVPVFPERDLKPGDFWVAQGVEVHDFRESYGIEQPYRIPFNAHYTYLGERAWKGKPYHAFSVTYRIFLEPRIASGNLPGSFNTTRTYPRRIQGASDQVIYWDIDQGQPAAYEEHFRMIFDLSDGQTWEYRGRAEAEVVEAPPMNKEEMAREIAEDVAQIPDASVRLSDEGVVISLENIQFAPDSAILLGSELRKLDMIADILLRYPERDILVGGHTALAGTAAGRLQLSEERAAAVANYLINKGVRKSERVIIRGYGAERPVADNGTPMGMQKNRRVEIVILEN